MIDIEVRASTIQGLGVFTLRAFRAGERIRRVYIVREITADSPLREDAGERVEHCAYPDGRVVLWGFPDRHVNHSCDPNAYDLHVDGEEYIAARRDIAAGEELTFDYNINTTGGSAWPCSCGAGRCAGTTLGDFFALPRERQREYRPLLADWFVRKHRDRLAQLDEATE